MTNQLTKITSGNFYNTQADFYQNQNSNEIYMTIEQLSECLGYKQRRGIEMILAKYDYLRDSEFSIPQNLFAMGTGRSYETTLITEDGIYEITMLSKKPKAKEFRAFVRKIIKGLRKGELILQYATTQNIDLNNYQETQNQILQELKKQNIQLVAQKKQIDKLENLVFTLIPNKPYSAWKSKMTPKIKQLETEHNTPFKTILHQIFETMKHEYGIPLDQYTQEWILQNPNAEKVIGGYDLIAIHPEHHELFEELVEHYEEVFMPVAI